MREGLRSWIPLTSLSGTRAGCSDRKSWIWRKSLPQKTLALQQQTSLAVHLCIGQMNGWAGSLFLQKALHVHLALLHQPQFLAQPVQLLWVPLNRDVNLGVVVTCLHLYLHLLDALSPIQVVCPCHGAQGRQAVPPVPPPRSHDGEHQPTAEQRDECVEHKRCSLAFVGLVGPLKSDYFAGVHHTVVVLFEVGENLARPIVDGHRVRLGWPIHSVDAGFAGGLGGALYEGPQAWDSQYEQAQADRIARDGIPRLRSFGVRGRLRQQPQRSGREERPRIHRRRRISVAGRCGHRDRPAAGTPPAHHLPLPSLCCGACSCCWHTGRDRAGVYCASDQHALGGGEGELHAQGRDGSGHAGV
mmetsp:Transcript_34920/g.87969  ORF Transcript_34920/g.87969 Transcript_34920/m.87969 type:complete len:358 (+) Transcript_34920:248-1321(+)